MAKTYYWLKLRNDWFSDKRIKKLRSIAGGDTYTIIYLKMELLSVKDEGYLFFEGVDDDFISELALDLDENEDDVRITVEYLQRSGLIESLEADRYLLTAVPECIGKEGSSAERVRKHRERKKIEENNAKALHCNTDVTDDCYNVQNCNTEIEIDIEKEKDIDIELEKSKIVASKADVVNYTSIIDLYNELCPSLPHVKSLSDARKKAIRARLNQYSMADVAEMFAKAESSAFLKGSNNRDWRADFDWLMTDKNFAKVLDGKYDAWDAPKKEQNSTLSDWMKA